MTFDQGDSIAAAAGFFNPMLGGESGVSVGGGGGGGFSGPFDIVGGKVTRCMLAFGRTWLSCADTALAALGRTGDPSGVIYATVEHPDDGGPPRLSVHHGESLPESGADATHRALYVAQGNDWTDVRFAPLVMSMD